MHKCKWLITHGSNFCDRACHMYFFLSEMWISCLIYKHLTLYSTMLLLHKNKLGTCCLISTGTRRTIKMTGSNVFLSQVAWFSFKKKGFLGISYCSFNQSFPQVFKRNQRLKSHSSHKETTSKLRTKLKFYASIL